jgi:Cu(I)/Ag(I) efflux system membrane fusion protein
MSRTKIVAIVVAIAVLLSAGLWYFKHSSMAMPMNHDMSMSEPMRMDMKMDGMDMDMGADAAKPALPKSATAEPRVLYWHDPMVPGQRFDKPGPSPFMDMQLVPVYADASGSSTGVSIAPETQQNLGIRTAKVRQGHISQEATVQGNVVWNEHAIDVLAARSSGFIERLYVRAAMESVKRGQALAEIYVPDWIAVQEEYLFTRELGGDMGDQLRSGAKQRMRVAGMTEVQIADVVRQGRVQARLTIRAPRDGVVAELSVREGDAVSMGMSLFRINGLNPIWLDAQVPESLISALHLGDEVSVTTVARANQRYVGKVSLLPPQIDQITRTQRVRIDLANPRAELLPGMFATLTITQGSAGNALIVPTEAIIASGQRTIVFVVNGDGKFSPQPVTTGLEGGNETEVLSGLSAGQEVVVSGQFLVDSEASLKGVMSRMQGDAP